MTHAAQPRLEFPVGIAVRRFGFSAGWRRDRRIWTPMAHIFRRWFGPEIHGNWCDHGSPPPSIFAVGGGWRS